jgi:hypothetical protein
VSSPLPLPFPQARQTGLKKRRRLEGATGKREPQNIQTFEQQKEEVQSWDSDSVLLHSPFDNRMFVGLSFLKGLVASCPAKIGDRRRFRRRNRPQSPFFAVTPPVFSNPPMKLQPEM